MNPLNIASAEAMFLAELPTIERAIRFACHRSRLHDEDADDFASHVKLRLIDDDYAVLRRYEGRSTFAAFIGVVVQRILFDYRISQWGKWHASAEARHLGETAIGLEAMLIRDGRTLEEALPAMMRRWPSLTRENVEEIARRLPPRARRPRTVELELAENQAGSGADHVFSAAFAGDRITLSRRIAQVIRATIIDLPEDDRLLFRLRFEGAMSVADIARSLGIEQKPLYRRLQRALALLRKSLKRAGIQDEEVRDILEGNTSELDFDFEIGKTQGPTAPRAEERDL